MRFCLARVSALFALVAVLGVETACAQTSPANQASTGPTLVVMITVDQLRPDYFGRWERQLTGGLGRLAKHGAFFTNGYQDHAITETAPGHSSTLSGRFPNSTGIVANDAGVLDPGAPLLDAPGDGASPFRFRGTTLIDWLRFQDPRSRALSISRKDRGAILPLGRAKQPAFWYSPQGRFTTSTYYADTLPTWVARFNARRSPQQYAGKLWETLLPSSEYSEPDSVTVESSGRDVVFPHPFPTDSAQTAAAFAGYPMMDLLTLALALEGLREMELGKGPSVDVLAVSLSATDAVGHRFGPDSREIHDQVIRLDRYLGAFLDTLFTLRDSARIVIALTSDHGVNPFPQVKSHDPNAGAGFVDLRPVTQATMARLHAAGVPNTAYRIDENVLYLDRDAFKRANADPDAAARAYVRDALQVPGVQRADLLRDLARADTTRDAIARRWMHMFPPDVGAAAVVTFKPYWTWAGSTSANHGSPNDYDAHVPILFYGSMIKRGQYKEFSRVVDIAPTLAAILGVKPMERLDGRVLSAALK